AAFLLLGSGFSGVVPWLGSVPVAAADDWCSDDPLVLVTLPSGQLLPVHITVMALGTVHLPTIKRAQVLGTQATLGQQPHTATVTIAVQVPGDELGPFKTKVIASSGENGTGTIYATTEGSGGSLHKLRFTVDDKPAHGHAAPDKQASDKPAHDKSGNNK